MKLICLKCGKGIIQWIDPEVKSLEDDMTCTSCHYIYNGMGEYIELMNASHTPPEEVELET